MIKQLVLYTGLMLLGVACKIPVTSRDNELIKEVYLNQKSYYDSKIIDKLSYVSIVNYASKGRGILYKKKGIDLSRWRNFIILEGYSPAWGDFKGLLLSENENYSYRNSNTGKWEMELIDLDSEDIEKRIGIKKNIIDKVRIWDTLSINRLKRVIGNSVSDGFVFMATKVQYIDRYNSQVQTIAFPEFAYDFSENNAN